MKKKICAALICLALIGATVAGAAGLASEDEDMLRGVQWDATIEECAQIEGVEAENDQVTSVGKYTLYGLDVKKVEYLFQDESIKTRRFTLAEANDEIYGALFFSLLTYYGEPSQIEARKAQWEMKDMFINIEKGKTVRVDFERKPETLSANEGAA